VLVIGNIVSNRLLPDWAYVPWNLAVTAVVLVVAGRAVGLAEQGWTRWRVGFRWGLAVVALTALVYVVGLVVVEDLFRDRRVDGGTARMLFETLVRIPLGTVVLEEVACRGALPAVLARRWGVRRAVVVASLLFGLWHVLPAWGIDDVNPVLDRVLGDGWAAQAGGIALAVAGTFGAGLWLSWLRYRSGSLLAPLLAHVGTNSLAYLLAWLVTR